MEKPITSQPVYGYLKGPDGHFVVDPEAAPVVKQIYSLCLAGNGPTKIARMLTEQNIPTPGTMEYRRTGSDRRYYPDYECKWSANTVAHILERREYLGHTVNFKTAKVSCQGQDQRPQPRGQGDGFEHTHEAIIDEATWGASAGASGKQAKSAQPLRRGWPVLRLLFCADCGSVVCTSRGAETDKRRQDCWHLRQLQKRTADCTAHFIRTDLLTAGVTENLRKVTSYAAKHEARFMKLMAQNEDGGKRKNAARRRRAEAAQKYRRLNGIFKRLYEDSVSGRITDERFMELSADYEQEQAALKARAAELQAELGKSQEAAGNVDKFMAVVRKYTSFEELTPTLLREFVEKIVVHECWKDEQGTRHQDIEIYYSFVGKVDLPDD